MVAISVLVLLLTVIHGPSEEQNDKKKEKRRIQNMKASKKSYENRKKERQILQQKNTDLVEAQKRLIRDKSLLQERIKLLKHIEESMTHTYITCKIKREPEKTSQIEFSTSRMNLGQRRSVRDDSSQALDLSVKNSRRYPDFSRNNAPEVQQTYHDVNCMPLITIISKSFDEHDQVVSSQWIREATEGGLIASVPERKIVKENWKIKQESDLLVPQLKKIKCEI